MKKLLFLFAIIFVPFNMSAQWDDVYYTPSKKSKTERAASNNTRSAAEEGFFEKQIKESNTGDYSGSSKQVSNLLSLPNGVYNVVVNKYTISFEDENLGTATNIYNLEDGYYTIYVEDDSIVIRPNTSYAPKYTYNYDWHYDYSPYYDWSFSYPYRRWWYWGYSGLWGYDYYYPYHSWYYPSWYYHWDYYPYGWGGGYYYQSTTNDQRARSLSSRSNSYSSTLREYNRADRMD